ncbi:hypothetical protein PV797_10140 [Clostridiaceae bacterium M8S5]|nr:hypothetical protein PV797_10140 [Clostridiaceae bacterium M8S5]
MEASSKVAKTIVNKIFSIKEGENLTVTFDKGSNKEVITSILEETKKSGGKGIAIEIAQPETECSGVNDYVPELVEYALNKTDCWLDAGSKVWIYSRPFENAFTNNEKLRYMIVGGIDTNALVTLFEGIDVDALKNLTCEIKDMVSNAKTMRFKSQNGSDLTFTINHDNIVALDNGNASIPGFHTPPALVNIVPDFNSSNGKLVSDAVMINEEWKVMDRPFEIFIKNGKITGFNGNPVDVSNLEKWLEKNGDENSYKVAHMSIGLSPNILELKGDIFYDERLFGCMNFGFGHVSPVDAPPKGQESKTHFDAVTEKASIWIDNIQIMEEGKFVLDKLKEYCNVLFE